ncbi:MAG: hypothetical protein ACKVRP_11420 [Bacteroidota bacterium]
MRTISRRRFAGLLIATPLMPALSDSLVTPTALHPDRHSLPERVAGYVMTAEEKRLAQKFVDNHEKSIAPLRQRVLPNDLPPFEFSQFIPKSKSKR